MTNLEDLPHFRARRTLREIATVAGSLALLIAAFAAWCYGRNYLLWYGDAQAHLNISRSLVDSRTPGYSQLGTVWLPLLHMLCLPFVRNNWLWSTGLAGTIPVALCFVFAGTCLYLSARVVYAGRMPAAVVLLCFALNPNVLYLSVIPMTEVVFIAALSLLLLCYARFRVVDSRIWLAGAVAALWAMCLTRYDGWFLIPFAALWFGFAATRHRLRVTLAVGIFASIAPLLWMAFNWFETANPLDFLNGPYSAQAIQGGRAYPGLHDWPVAALYYGGAALLCSGWPLLAAGAIGCWCAARNKTWTPVALLALTPLFYVWSIHSSQTPIFVPQFPPHGHYNTRYGIAVVPLAAFSAGALADALQTTSAAWHKWKRYALCVPLLCIVPWLLHPTPESWVCWRESRLNSVARRDWTRQAARYFDAHYGTGEGILTEFGDLTGVFCQARIPLRETLHEGNGPAWWGGSRRPSLYHPASWAMAQRNDSLSKFLHNDPESTYRVAEEIAVPGAPVLEIFARNLQTPLELKSDDHDSIHQTARR